MTRTLVPSWAGCVGVSALLHGGVVMLAPRLPSAREPAACELQLNVVSHENEILDTGAVVTGSIAPSPLRDRPPRRAGRRSRIVAGPSPEPQGPSTSEVEGPSAGDLVGASTSGKGFEAEAVWSAPVPLDANEPPHYPRIARVSGIEGEVVARLLVREDGTVANVQIVEGLQLFQEEVLRAVRRWRYQPASEGGHAVATLWLVRIPFSLH